MSVGNRDEEFVRRGIERWLSATSGGEAVVTSLKRPSLGYSGETNLVEVEISEHGQLHHRSLVVRLPPGGPGAHPVFDLVAQTAAQRVAGAAGVPIAEPLELVEDSSWLGDPFLTMAWVKGPVVGEIAGYDRWVRSLDQDGQRRLHEGFVDVLAKIHEGDVDRAAAAGVPRRSIGDELEQWGHYLEWSAEGEPLPVLARAMEHCRATAPTRESPGVLLWGDVRLGNVVIGEDLAPRAVLDWDMCSIGAPEHDVAWMTSLDWTQQQLVGSKAEGLLDRDAVLARYESAAGRALLDLEWFETFAMVRSTALLTRIGYLQRAAGQKPSFPIEDNPLLDLLAERL